MNANDGNEPDIDDGISDNNKMDKEIGVIMEAATSALAPRAGVRARVYQNVLREFELATTTADAADPAERVPANVVPLKKTGSTNTLAGWAMAASVLFAISAVFWVIQRAPFTPASEYWTARITQGELLMPQNAGVTGSTIRLSPGFELTTGGKNSAELQLHDSTLLRLDRTSALTMQGRTSFQLTRGSVYVDNTDPKLSIQIHSRGGTVTEIGTQYAVRLKDDSTEIAVREGRIELRTPNGALLQSAAHQGDGELMKVSLEGGVSRVVLGRTDDWWSWVKASSAPFVLENATVHQYLEWACREHGLELLYASEIVEVQARQSTLQSTLQGQTIPLPSEETFADMLELTRYTGHRIDDTFEVDFRR